MTPHSRTTAAASPLSSSFVRFASLAFVLVTALLAGCATQQAPGLPSDPVLTTGGPAIRPLLPNGPLQAITPGQAGSHQIASTEPPKELWDRIRRGFAMPDLQNELVTDREQWYASRPLLPNGPLQAITPGQAGSHQIASTEPPKELWDRIRRGFAMPDL